MNGFCERGYTKEGGMTAAGDVWKRFTVPNLCREKGKCINEESSVMILQVMKRL